MLRVAEGGLLLLELHLQPLQGAVRGCTLHLLLLLRLLRRRWLRLRLLLLLWRRLLRASRVHLWPLLLRHRLRPSGNGRCSLWLRLLSGREIHQKHMLISTDHEGHRTRL